MGGPEALISTGPVQGQEPQRVGSPGGRGLSVLSPSFLTFPFRLWIRNGIVGESSSSKNSFSNIFFFRRSMARLCPLLAFCRGQRAQEVLLVLGLHLPPHRFFFFPFIFIRWRLITILWWFLPYIDMNQSWIYMCSPSQSPLPPPSHPVVLHTAFLCIVIIFFSWEGQPATENKTAPRRTC